ncbi:hypothetical protein [Streptomyces kanamyceticus]|uniref:hypothetical protein n=1 Tax=Streptomyces kanamyceticus TaxID=1967 RepID=UPI0037DC11A6
MNIEHDAPPTPPELAYVLSVVVNKATLAHTGVKREELTVLAAPPGAWGNRLFDPASLTVPAFVVQVRAALGPAGAGAVGEVFAL